jgi:hypothetical protein
MTPAISYRSTLFPGKPRGQARVRYLLPQSAPGQFAAYAFDQELSINAGGFPPAPRNTPATNAAFGVAAFTPPSATQSSDNAILTAVTQPADRGAALLEYTGSFAIVPASWDDFQTQVVNFPGWLNVVTGAAGFRDALPKAVTVRLHRDYFVIDPNNVAAGVLDSGGTAIVRVAAKGLIPILPKTPWLNMFSATGVPPWTAILYSEAKALVPAAGLISDNTYYPTLPSIEQYRAWCAVAAAFVAAGTTVWDETHPPLWDGASAADVTSGQYRLDDSRLEDYAGNIVARVTPYVMPR